MARGLAHPTAHINTTLRDIESGLCYVYLGFKFFDEIKPEEYQVEIIREVNAPKKSGAIFYFESENIRYGIVFYSSSVTENSKISPRRLGMQHTKGGATEKLGIQSSNIIRNVTKKEFILDGRRVQCAVFDTAQKLKNTIINHLSNNQNVGPHIVEIFKKYFVENRNLMWDERFETSEINELGKYLGELLLGYIVLQSPYSSKVIPNKFGGKSPLVFVVPDDVKFSGIDSAFILNDDEKIPISSKFGTGAAASIFPNILPSLISKSRIERSVIGDLVKAARDVNITESNLINNQGTKEIVYEYGVRNILGLGKREIKNSYKIFSDIKKKVNSEDVELVVAKIIDHPDIDDKVKRLLPSSVTAAFNREIARRMNNDDVSIKIAKRVIASKNFWQANLNLTEFHKGIIKYKMMKSGRSDVTIVGNKAAINDINASHGMINFKLVNRK